MTLSGALDIPPEDDSKTICSTAFERESIVNELRS